MSTIVYVPLHFFLNCRPVGIGQRFSMGLRRKYAGGGGLTERSTKEGVITGRNVTLAQFLLDSRGGSVCEYANTEIIRIPIMAGLSVLLGEGVGHKYGIRSAFC